MCRRTQTRFLECLNLGIPSASAEPVINTSMVRGDFHTRQQVEADSDRFVTIALDMFCIASSDGYFKRLNPAFTQTLGWSVEEMLARPFLDFVHPDDRAATLAEVERQVARGEKVLHFENRYQHKDGSWRVLSWRSVAHPGGFMYATARDVTELKQSQEALRRSEESLAVTLHSIGDGVMATDSEGRVTRMNPVAEKLTGWSQSEAQGRSIVEVFQIINEGTRQPAVIPVDTVLTTGEIHGLANHTVLIARDGTEWPIADIAAPIRDKSGRILGVVLVFRDVTAERKAERSLLESEQQLRALNEELEQRVEERTAEVGEALATLDATADATLIFEPETLCLRLVNEGAERQVGYSREELLTMTVVDINPEFEEGRFRTLIAPLLRGEARVHRFTTRHRHKDGHDIPVEINLQYVARQGKSSCFICIARDISERLKSERLALRSQRLESLGTLAGGVAHDLNNALAPILMSVELLRMQYPDESQMLGTIQASAKRGADMVRQLLTFAKGAEGERVSIQPAHLIKEMLGIMKGTFPKNIRLEFDCDKKLPTVLGDATQLHQVLLNLCVNARDAMPHGGTLTLEAESREVDAVYASSVPDAKPGKYVVLRVRDTGTGIQPEILDRIFDPFFTTKNPDKGTGLGLSTVMGIVKGHGGFVQVYSQLGLGSTFAAYLPADRMGSDTQHVFKSDDRFRGHEETVLLVDDEAAIREIGRAVLRRLNFKPLTATDGADGLMQAAEHRTDLSAVIIDLHMPHMDGLGFARALRRMLPDMPIVVASGRLDEITKVEFKSLGVTMHLAKPFTEAQLADVLKNIFAPK
jgi:PAS domain S-box-containing protein